jgi:hypothetical protein
LELELFLPLGRWNGGNGDLSLVFLISGLIGFMWSYKVVGGISVVVVVVAGGLVVVGAIVVVLVVVVGATVVVLVVVVGAAVVVLIVVASVVVVVGSTTATPPPHFCKSLHSGPGLSTCPSPRPAMIFPKTSSGIGAYVQSPVWSIGYFSGYLQCFPHAWFRVSLKASFPGAEIEKIKFC